MNEHSPISENQCPCCGRDWLDEILQTPTEQTRCFVPVWMDEESHITRGRAYSTFKVATMQARIRAGDLRDYVVAVFDDGSRALFTGSTVIRRGRTA